MGVFGNGPNFNKRFIPDYDQLKATIVLFKEAGMKVVLTSGSFDMLHEGHALYLEKAHSLGDVLIVGVDSDEKLRQRKGPDRPVVPEQERLHMLTHLRSVDIVTLKTPAHPHLELLRIARPDVLVISKSTKERTASELEELASLCGRIEELEPQAVLGTSARIRLLHVTGAQRITSLLEARLPEVITDVLREVLEGKGV